MGEWEGGLEGSVRNTPGHGGKEGSKESRRAQPEPRAEAAAQEGNTCTWAKAQSMGSWQQGRRSSQVRALG